MQWFTLYASPLGIDLGSASLIYELAVKEYKEDKEESDQKYQALVTVHNVFCTAIRKAIGMECEMPVKDIVDTVVAVARNHRTLYEENAVLCQTLDRLLAASPETERRASEGNSVPSDFLPARSTSEFNLRGIKNCPICGTEIVATPNGIQPKKPNPSYANASHLGSLPDKLNRNRQTNHRQRRDERTSNRQHLTNRKIGSHEHKTSRET